MSERTYLYESTSHNAFWPTVMLVLLTLVAFESFSPETMVALLLLAHVEHQL